MKQQLTSLLASALVVGLTAVSLAKDKQQDARDLQSVKTCLRQARLSAVDAIDPAMKKVPGGKAVQVDLRLDNGQPVFQIEIVDRDGKHMEINVDAIKGAAGEAVEEQKTAETNEDDEKAEDAASKAKITLVRAIDAAQKRVPNGKVFAACSEMDDGNPVFCIKFISGDKIMRAQVDCGTGKVVNLREEA